MEKQTMKVMCNGATVTVFVKPFCNDGPVYDRYSVDWFFKNVNGLEHYNCKYCTPVPEKRENDLERARRLRSELKMIWKPVEGNPDGDFFYRVQAVVPILYAYESAISRLTAGAWDDEDMADACAWGLSAQMQPKDQEIIALQFEIARLKKEGLDLLVYRDEEINKLRARVSELEKQVDAMKELRVHHERTSYRPGKDAGYLSEIFVILDGIKNKAGTVWCNACGGYHEPPDCGLR